MNKSNTKSLCLSLLLLCSCCLGGKAQDRQPVRFDLQECLQYGLENSYELHKAKFGTQESEAAHKEAKSALLPQLNGSVSVTDNLKLATSMMPGDFFGMPGELIGIEMGVKYSAVAGIELEQVVFDARLFTGIKVSQNARELALLKERMSKEELIYNISNTFYDILYSQSLLQNNIKTLGLMDSIYMKMELQVALNITREIDLNRMKVNISNMKVDIQKTAATLSQQMNYLKVLMGMPLEYRFLAKGNMELSPLEIYLSSVQENYAQNKTELLILNNEKKSGELEIRQLRQAYLPTLSLFASSSYNFENEQFTIGKHPFWSNGTYFGVKLSIPIFDGGAKHHKIRQAQFRLRQVEEDLKQQQQTIESDGLNARRQLQVAFQSANAQQENMEVAEKSYKQGIMLYQEGLYSITDLLDIEKSYREAQSAYTYELSNYHKSILELKKSEGALTTLLNQ
ncbi:outer membrane protein [Parabacteroides sp. PF5-5]|uniref:TolC family protein n=1 Tax=unclassified Parabacteroides TaxID=2649774 RepID=UPI002475E596|nr:MULTISPECIES: TolC family protein [unclassified Parabacteroides]MDH6303994.1 outer membrane protein [Parabacteroides sp. PH5-39]MDH6315291.1 outer membrane protein [Parabacteroides sp. PF5-13]MDH6318951.1 outer membrane protein [Parabacteroides sp. PH5-13]MDH6322680.1 outer membrane protein [Parabacteroides sp. PH5-8]MDH6326183.1 outer membrane protein [Parabacteroides sp. PH5-41]